MRRILALIVAGGVALAACADGGGDAAVATGVTMVAGERGETFEEVSDELAASPDDGSDLMADLEVAEGRDIIRRASLELHASDTRAAFDEIVAEVESAGGFVASAQISPTEGEDEQPRITIVLRVPVDRLNATMKVIKASADEVVVESQHAEDVTEQFIDLEARLTNLEALEVELRALLQEVRQQEGSDPEKILRVFNELSSVRGQIEQIQGQLNHLEDLTTLATLEVGLTQTPSAVPIVDQPWAPGEVARDAIRNLVTGLQGAADWVINFALYALPMLLITLGPLVAIAVLVYRRWFRRQPAAATPAGS